MMKNLVECYMAIACKILPRVMPFFWTLYFHWSTDQSKVIQVTKVVRNGSSFQISVGPP